MGIVVADTITNHYVLSIDTSFSWYNACVSRLFDLNAAKIIVKFHFKSYYIHYLINSISLNFYLNQAKKFYAVSNSCLGSKNSLAPHQAAPGSTASTNSSAWAAHALG